ncbi:MAG: transporter substrate-binding domain-containing protein [Bacteroidota bacterium]
MHKIVPIITVAFLMIGCSNPMGKEPSEDSKNSVRKEQAIPFQKDLDDILADGKLRAITTYSSTSYFLYKGHPMGFEYELLKSFADYIGVELEIIVSNNIDNLFTNLNSGRADIVAHGLTITNERKEEVLFTDYLYLTNQVLVQKKPDNWRKMKWSALEHSLIHDAIELIGDTVSVREETSYMQRLSNMSDEIGGEIVIDTLQGTTTTADAIEMVLNGEIKYTVSDNNVANVFATYYPILDIDVPISFSQRIAWATRETSPQLNETINKWLAYIKKEVFYYIIYNKYFKNSKDFRKRTKSEFYSLNNQKISKYDDLLKKRAMQMNWDWRLLTSLVYQESRFQPGAESWAGAVGLMQLMPATATELGVRDRSNPVESMEGGTKYLHKIYGYFDSIPDETQRIKFTIASYNCGYGHVRDAQRLAPKYDLNPEQWDDHVEKMILALNKSSNYNDPVVKFGYIKGIEPYNYVRQIFERYDHYQQFIKE